MKRCRCGQAIEETREECELCEIVTSHPEGPLHEYARTRVLACLVREVRNLGAAQELRRRIEALERQLTPLPLQPVRVNRAATELEQAEAHELNRLRFKCGVLQDEKRILEKCVAGVRSWVRTWEKFTEASGTVLDQVLTALRPHLDELDQALAERPSAAAVPAAGGGA